MVTSRAWSACPFEERERLRGRVVFEGVMEGSQLAPPASNDTYTVKLCDSSGLGESPSRPHIIIEIQTSDLTVRSIRRPKSPSSDIPDFESLVAMLNFEEIEKRESEDETDESKSEDVSRRHTPSRVPGEQPRPILARQVQESFLDVVWLAAKEAQKAFPQMIPPEQMDYTLKFVADSDGRVRSYTVTFYRVVIGVVVPFREIAVTLSGDTLEVIRVERLH